MTAGQQLQSRHSHQNGRDASTPIRLLVGLISLAVFTSIAHSQTPYETALEQWKPGGILDQIVDIDVSDVSLSEALDELSDELEINILLDAAILRDEGLSP